MPERHDDAAAADAPLALGRATVGTPDGPFIVILAGLGADAPVLASSWAHDPASLLRDLRRAGVPPQWSAGFPGWDALELRRVGPCRASDAVEAYYAGDLAAPGRVPVTLFGPPFLLRARQAMRRVPPGQTWTYARLAAEAGSPRASRAAGSACSGNPAALFVPCHRILPASGRPGAFGAGPHVKVSLLAREAGLRRPPTTESNHAEG